MIPSREKLSIPRQYIWLEKNLQNDGQNQQKPSPGHVLRHVRVSNPKIPRINY